MTTNGNSPHSDRLDPRTARLSDPDILRDLLVAHDERFEELRGDIAERDGKIIGALGRIETMVQESNALAHATAVRVHRLDRERELPLNKIAEVALDLRRVQKALGVDPGKSTRLNIRDQMDSISEEIEEAKAAAKKATVWNRRIATNLGKVVKTGAAITAAFGGLTAAIYMLVEALK